MCLCIHNSSHHFTSLHTIMIYVPSYLRLLLFPSDDFLDRQNQEFYRKFPEDPSPKMMGRVWVDDSAATPKISSWPS